MATNTNPITNVGAVSSRDALMARLRSLTYQVDHTGTKVENKVIETRTLTDANRSDFNHIVPKAAPFYADSMRVFHTQTNDELIRGQDYYCVGTFVKATLNVVENQRICWAVIFDDPRISGEYRLEYQTVGGDFVLDQAQMAEILANHMENPRIVDWEDLVGVPLTFPPAPHDLPVNTLVGVESTNQELHLIYEALRNLGIDEETAHPGYGQVIVELLRQNNKQVDLEKRLTDTSSEIKNNLDDAIAQLNTRINTSNRDWSNSIANTRQEFNNLLQAEVNARSEADLDLSSRLTTLIQTTASGLDTAFKAADKSLKTLIEQKDAAQTAAKSALDTSLRAEMNRLDDVLRTNLEAKIETVDDRVTTVANKATTDLNKAKSDLSSSITNLGNTLRNEFKAADNVVNDRLTSEVSKINGSISTINTTLSNGTFVKCTTNEAVGGIKTFTSKELRIGVSQNDAEVAVLRTDVAGKVLTISRGGNKTDFIHINEDGSVDTRNGQVIVVNGEQTMMGLKNFKHRIRFFSDTDASNTRYSEINLEEDNYFRFCTTEDRKTYTNRMWMNKDGWSGIVGYLTVRDPNNLNRGFDFRHQLDDPHHGSYILFEGANQEPNAGRLSVQDLYIRSDIRDKENIQRIKDPLEKLQKMNGYTYNLNGSPARSGGLIAQEVLQVFPDAVHLLKSPQYEERYSMHYHAITGLLLEGIKELTKRIETLEQEKQHE